MVRQLTIGNLALAPPVLLAPMAGFSDLPFRLGIRKLGGVGLAFTEMLNPASLLRGRSRRRSALLATCDDDRPLGYQLYGKDADEMAAGARWLVEHGAPLVDLNMGCPQRKISSRGSGAGLLRTPELACEIARRVVEAVDVPVTAKLRLGWDDGDRTAASLARDLASAGIAAVTIHGRVRAQGFGGYADYSAIRAVVETVPQIPVIGNGDIDTPAAALRMFEETGCAGIMIARGALWNPWLLRDIAHALRGEPLPPPPAREDWLALAESHFAGIRALYGEAAVVLFRKWLVRYARGLGLDKVRRNTLLQVEDVDALWAELLRS